MPGLRKLRKYSSSHYEWDITVRGIHRLDQKLLIRLYKYPTFFTIEVWVYDEIGKNPFMRIMKGNYRYGSHKGIYALMGTDSPMKLVLDEITNLSKK